MSRVALLGFPILTGGYVNALEKISLFLTGKKISRALSFGQILEQVSSQWEVLNPGAYAAPSVGPDGVPMPVGPAQETPVDIYLSDGALSLVTTKEGRLLRYPLSIKGDLIMLGKQEFVSTEFTTQKRSVFRSTGERWFIITGTAVINRDAQIDSRLLYDNFIRRADESGRYPYFTIFHLGEQFKVGQADWLARDEYVYMASGTWEDNDLARAAKKALEEDTQGYWGASNRFLPIGEPEVIRAEDTDIPVFQDGIHIEISMLPEFTASSLFTRSTTITEVNRMNKVVQDALKKIFAGDEAKAAEWIEKIDDVNRSIQEAEMIARHEGEHPAPVGEVLKVEQRQDPPADAPAGDAPPPEGEGGGGATVPATIEIDDTLLQKIAEAVVKIMEEKKMAAPTESQSSEEVAKQVDAKMSTTNETLRTVQSEMNDFAGKLTAVMQDLLKISQEIETMQQGDEDKKRSWLDEMTNQVVPLHITYRPRDKERNADPEQPAQLPSMADIANETLAALNAKEKMQK